MPGVTVRDVDVSCNFPVLLLGHDCELRDSFCFAPTQSSQDSFGCCTNLLLTIALSTRSKIHYSIRRVPQATRQTSNSRLELHYVHPHSHGPEKAQELRKSTENL